jgi:hypothetical protein
MNQGGKGVKRLSALLATQLKAGKPFYCVNQQRITIQTSKFIRQMNANEFSKTSLEPSTSIHPKLYEKGGSSRKSFIETVTTRHGRKSKMPILREVYVSRTLHSIPGVPEATKQVVPVQLVLPSMQVSGLVMQRSTDSYYGQVGQGQTGYSRSRIGSRESSYMQISGQARQHSTESRETIYSGSFGHGATDSSSLQILGLGETESSRDKGKFYCHECNKSYSGKRQLQRHLIKHREPNKYSCSISGCKQTAYRYTISLLTFLELMLCALMS